MRLALALKAVEVAEGQVEAVEAMEVVGDVPGRRRSDILWQLSNCHSIGYS